MLASTTDKGEGFKKAFSATLQAVDAALETVGIASPTLQSLGGAANTHPLGETYYTQTPFRYGDYIAKINVSPVSPNLTMLTGDMVETSDRPDALREVIRETMIEAGGEWEVRVQLCTDLETMPIEVRPKYGTRRQARTPRLRGSESSRRSAGDMEPAIIRRTVCRSGRGTASRRISR